MGQTTTVAGSGGENPKNETGNDKLHIETTLQNERQKHNTMKLNVDINKVLIGGLINRPFFPGVMMASD